MVKRKGFFIININTVPSLMVITYTFSLHLNSVYVYFRVEWWNTVKCPQKTLNQPPGLAIVKIIMCRQPSFAKVGYCYPVENTIHQAPIVQSVDSTIHWINHYPLDNSIDFDSTYVTAGWIALSTG